MKLKSAVNTTKLFFLKKTFKYNKDIYQSADINNSTNISIKGEKK